ncbi:MAG: hypothetical protein AAGA20_03065 [Planctomycetota bacterium]
MGLKGPATRRAGGPAARAPDRTTKPENDDHRRDRDALLAQASEGLEHLHRGAHARDAATSIDFHLVWEAPLPTLRASRVLSQIASAKMRLLCEEGDQIAGVETLLDAHQYASDLAVSPVQIEVLIGLSLLGPPGPTISESLAPFWRFGFSWRAAAADYVERGVEASGLVVPANRLSPESMVAAMDEFAREANEDHNPFVRSAFWRQSSLARSRSWCLARFSYLRHALALELGRTPCELVDPFGMGVTVTRDGGVLRIEAEVEDDNPNDLGIAFRFE